MICLCTSGMCGDNQWHIEKNVRPDQIIGTVIKIQRSGKTFTTKNIFYKLYVTIWVAIRPLRHILIGGTRKIFKFIK